MEYILYGKKQQNKTKNKIKLHGCLSTKQYTIIQMLVISDCFPSSVKLLISLGFEIKLISITPPAVAMDAEVP